MSCSFNSDDSDFLDSSLAKLEKEGCCGRCAAVESASSSPSRRVFMQSFLGLVALGWSAMAGYPFIRYMTSSVEEDPKSIVSSAVIGKQSDFPIGSGKNIEFGGKPALVYRDKQGEFHAFNAVCTHLGCTVQYQADTDQILCACHGGIYKADSGENIAGPPPKPLSPYKVTTEGEQITLHRS